MVLPEILKMNAADLQKNKKHQERQEAGTTGQIPATVIQTQELHLLFEKSFINVSQKMHSAPSASLTTL